MAKYKDQEYSKVMLFGTADVDQEGKMWLTDVGKRRGDRAAEAYYSDETIQILIAGGYGKSLFDSVPDQTEAQLLADYLVGAYKIPASALRLEEKSTTTDENFAFSIAQYPEFFEDIVSGDKKLGLVSQANHLSRIAEIGRRALGLIEEDGARFIDLAAWQPAARARKVELIGASAVERVAAAAD